jgi:hypothetical protein
MHVLSDAVCRSSFYESVGDNPNGSRAATLVLPVIPSLFHVPSMRITIRFMGKSHRVNTSAEGASSRSIPAIYRK